jgi:hypothetical protein
VDTLAAGDGPELAVLALEPHQQVTAFGLDCVGQQDFVHGRQDPP